MPTLPSASLWLALLAVAAYGLRFGAAWLMLERVPTERFDPHGFGLLGDLLELMALALPLGVLLWWILRRRGPWRGLLAPAASPGRTVLSVLLLLVIGAPTLGQVWAMILLPVSACWPVVLSALLWFAVVALLRAQAVTRSAPRSGATGHATAAAAEVAPMPEPTAFRTALGRGVLVGAISLAMPPGHAAAQPTPVAPTPAPSAANPPLPPGLITTHAESRRRLPNTVADAVVSIEVHGRDLRGTAGALARQSQTLLTFLRSQPTERLRTDGTSFEPELQELRGQPDRIKGYTGRISVSFRTTPDQLPFLLAGSLDNGATALGQFGASPREPEIEAARREMVAEAGESALAQARTIAASVGQRIAGVQVVEVDPLPRFGPDPVMFGQLAERAARPAPPLRPIANEAGDSGLSVTVVMTLRLAPPE